MVGWMDGQENMWIGK